MSHDPRPNPYQPPASIAEELDSATPTAVTFQLNARLLRHATDQYLLHWYPSRLLFCSLILIVVSTACLVASIRYGTVGFLPTLVAVMLFSAAIYTALVHQTKKQIGRRLKEFGLASDEPMTLRSDPDQLRLIHQDGTHTWRHDQLRIHRTRRGLLICPEPLLFIFVPKQSEFEPRSYRRFVQVILSRTSRKTASL